MSNCSGEDSKTTILNPTRRQLLAFGLAGAAAAWMGPELGWVTRAEAAGPPPKPTGQAIVGLSQEPTVFNPLMLHIEVDEAVYFNLFSGLWRVDPKGNFIPDLAARDPDPGERRHFRRWPDVADQASRTTPNGMTGRRSPPRTSSSTSS